MTLLNVIVEQEELGGVWVVLVDPITDNAEQSYEWPISDN